MQIQIDTGHRIEGSDALTTHVREVVTHAMAHEAARVTRVEVHLSDENGPHGGGDVMRCTMQARLERHQPLDVTCDAPSLHQAIAGAATKLGHLVEHTVGKLRDERRRRTDPAPELPQ